MGGTDAVTKTDEISEKFKTAFDPHFREFFFVNLYQFHAQKKPYLRVQNLQHRFLDWK